MTQSQYRVLNYLCKQVGINFFKKTLPFTTEPKSKKYLFTNVTKYMQQM